MKKFIEQIPLLPLVLISIYMLFAPFVPQGHLAEKYQMLMNGNLTRLIDIFDVFWHLTPLTILAIKLIQKRKLKSAEK